MFLCSTETKPNNKVPQAEQKFAQDNKQDDADQGQYNRKIMELTLSRLLVVDIRLTKLPITPARTSDFCQSQQ